MQDASPGEATQNCHPHCHWQNPEGTEGAKGLAELNTFCERLLEKYIEQGGSPEEKLSLRSVSVVDVVVEFDAGEAIFRPLEIQDGAWLLDVMHCTGPVRFNRRVSKIADALVQYAVEIRALIHQ